MSLTVWQIDAAQMTPFYNLALSRGLIDAGCGVRYVASTFLYADLDYPPDIHLDLRYFRGLDRKWLLSRPALRQLLRGLSYPFDNYRLLRDIRKHKPDIVHFQWSRLPRFDLPLIRAIRKLNIPVVHTVHDVVPLFESGAVPRLYQIYRECDALIVHSDANRITLLNEFKNLDNTKIHIVPHIELTVPEPPDTSMTRARELLGIPQDTFVVLFFGVIKHYKGLDILLESIKAVNKQSDRFTWLIAGRASDATQESYLNKIREFDRTHVFNDYIPDEDVWQFYRASNLSVFPYRQIFQSGALISAMNFGLPVIATDVGSFPETLDNNGILIPPENSGALTSALLNAIDNPDLTDWGKQSKHIIDTYHHSGKVGEKLRDIYESLIGLS